MSRAALLLLLLYPVFAQSQLPSPRTPSSQPEPALLEIQALLDAGKLKEAENADRIYLAAHSSSADAHFLLGYILFRNANPKSSLAEYTEGARYRAPAALDLEVMGCDYFLLEDYPAADKWFSKAVEQDPTDAMARFYLGRARFNEKHLDDAIRAFTECLRTDPRNSQASNHLGLSYEALGKTEEAMKAYRDAISSDPNASDPYLNLGALLAQDQRPAEAVSYLIHAAQTMPSDPRVHRELGKAYLALNQLQDARAEFEKAVELAPENGPGHFLLSQALRKLGLADQAGVEAERYTALTGTHSSPDTPLQEIRSLIQLGKLRDAEQLARRYIEIHKNSGEGHFLLGYVLFNEKDAKSSLAEYTEGAKYRKPTAADLEAVAGDYVLLNDYPDADKWFTKAVEWNPNDVLGWYYLGRTKYNENRFEEAIAAFEKCLALNGKDVKAEDNLGLSYEGLNRVEDAIAAYRTAISWQRDASTKDAGPYLNLGNLLAENEQAAEGLRYLNTAASIAPSDFRVHRALGKAYSHLNQNEKARAELEKAVTLAPENAPIHFMLAQVYRKLGLTEKAKLESEQYTKLNNASPQAQN
ncbi:MAG TPA: tetratricopeptide repeat protein [Bryobacteraceae bacterium]|nr:tetratricopeptide repeat protein [Bryobacteraceae bacterium]